MRWADGAVGPGTAGAGRSDAEFLAGFIALRRLNNTDWSRQRHFAARSRRCRQAAITQGRALLLAGPHRRSRATTRQATRHERIRPGRRVAGRRSTVSSPSRALDEDDATLAERIRAARMTPAATRDQVRWTSPTAKNVRAAVMLVAWGEAAPRPCLHPAAWTNSASGRHGSTRALSARLATALGDAGHGGVRSRGAWAGRDGRDADRCRLADRRSIRRPVPIEPGPRPSVVMRQESSFDIAALSPGRRPRADATDAGDRAGRWRTGWGIGERERAPVALTTDAGAQHAPRHRLSSAALLDQFGGVDPARRRRATTPGPTRVNGVARGQTRSARRPGRREWTWWIGSS